MIKLEDFPIDMNSMNIEILARMMMEIPPSEEWRKISDIISYEERNLIREKVREIQAEAQICHKTIDSQADSVYEVFRGNILQQELDSIELERRQNINKKV